MSDQAQERLEALGGMTAETDAANPSPEQAAQAQASQQAALDDEQEAINWGSIPFTLGGVLTLIEPALAPVYSEERCLMWGRRMHAVAKKRGWTSPSGPELALLSSTATFVVPSVMLVRAKFQQIRDGSAPADSIMAKIGLWWRTRKARKGMAAAVKPQADQKTGNDGRQQ